MRPRSCAPSLALALACAPQTAPRDPNAPDDEVRSEQDPLADAALARLRTSLSARAPLYWRTRTADGPRCEPWQPEPDPEDPGRGRLVHTADGARYSFTYQIAESQLQLTDPTRERDTPIDPAPPNPETRVAAGTMTLALAFPCVFSGMSLTPADRTASRQLVLTGHESWFLDEAACTSPKFDTPTLRPLGCASALADPATRTRIDPRPPGPAAKRLRAARRLWLLRARDGETTCESWRHTTTEDDEGQLGRKARDEHGPLTLRYGYAVTGDTLTLLGPNEFRTVRTPNGRAELAHTSGCLLSRPLAARGDIILVGADPWFLTRRACESVRRAGTPAKPDPDCRTSPVPKASH